MRSGTIHFHYFGGGFGRVLNVVLVLVLDIPHAKSPRRAPTPKTNNAAVIIFHHLLSVLLKEL